MSRVIPLLLVAALALPAVAQTTDVRKTVETLLGGIEKPAGDDEWVALGDVAVPHLLAIAGDEGTTRSTRARAVAALGNFSGEEVVGFLRQVLDSGDATLQRKALRSLARAGGAAELERIGAFLDSENTTLREAAAHALGILGTDEARAALTARLAVETSTAVTATIEEELAQ